MGTNYYLRHSVAHCPTCDCEKGFHLGKSSGGWRFSLRVYPDKGIHDWNDVFQYVSLELNKGYFIADEYGRPLILADWVPIVTRRSDTRGEWAEHTLDGDHCIGRHPTLPIDYIIGDFS